MASVWCTHVLICSEITVGCVCRLVLSRVNNIECESKNPAGQGDFRWIYRYVFVYTVHVLLFNQIFHKSLHVERYIHQTCKQCNSDFHYEIWISEWQNENANKTETKEENEETQRMALWHFIIDHLFKNDNFFFGVLKIEKTKNKRTIKYTHFNKIKSTCGKFLSFFFKFYVHRSVTRKSNK